MSQSTSGIRFGFKIVGGGLLVALALGVLGAVAVIKG